MISYYLEDVNLMGIFLWSISLFLELSIMSALAIVASLIISSAVTSVMSCFSFYILSRMISFFTTLERPLVDRGGNIFEDFMGIFVKFVSILLPRFDLYAKSSWVIYSGETIGYVWLWQSAIYIVLLLSMAIVDFRRKQF